MAIRKVLAAEVALGLLTVAALVDLYLVAFAGWMTAYPFVDASRWRIQLCFRLAIFAVIAVSWFVLAPWLFRQRRESNYAARAS